MRAAGYIVSAVLSMLLLACSAICGSAAGRNHLSVWWLPAYGSLFAGFALVALNTCRA